MTLGKITKFCAILFSAILIAVLAWSSLSNYREQKEWDKYKTDNACVISSVEKRDNNYNNPKNLATNPPATTWKCKNGEEVLR